MHPRSRRVLLVASALLAPVLPAAADPPPAPWVVRDLGSPGAAGATEVDASGVWTLQGSGRASGNADQFHFAYQLVRGDASLTARFLSLTGLGRAGLIVRENDTPGSPNLHYPMTGKGLFATRRFEQDKTTGSLGAVGPSSKPEPNLYLRLQRAGTEITGFYSRDGLVWLQAFDPLALPTLKEEALFGLTVSAPSAQPGERVTVKLDQVNVQPGAVLASGVQACGGDRAVLLQWRKLPSALGYNIYRGPAGATPDRLVRLNADRVPGTSFSDMGEGLVNGTPLTYAVAAVFLGADGNLVEGPLVAVPATPVSVPPGFLGCSIHEGPNTGSAVFDTATGEITLRGSGVYFESGENADGFYSLSQLVEGDVQITVKILTYPTGTSDNAGAGIIIHESLDAGTRNLAFGIRRAIGLGYGWRTTTNGVSSASTIGSVRKLPIVLRLTRKGNTITPEYSTDDGKTFRAGRPVAFDPPLAKVLYVGLIIHSQDRSKISEAKFSNLQIQKL